jgi:UDPglucose 6-dehydrogenase
LVGGTAPRQSLKPDSNPGKSKQARKKNLSPADTEVGRVCGAERGREGPMRPTSIAIVGSGVVGTATGAGFAAKGHRVVFCDVSAERVAILRKRGFHTVEAAELPEVRPDAYLLSVPTPTGDEGRADLSFVKEAARSVGAALASHPGRPVVVVRSTVPPGTTEDVVLPALEGSSGLTAGTHFGLGMNPEFLRAISAEEDFLHPRVIVIGALDQRSLDGIRALYAPWTETPIVSTTIRTAESIKYVSNLFNATKISFFNEMHRMLTLIGADPDVAFSATQLGAEGMWNPAYGTRGGLPYDGVCLPKDSAAFLGFAEDLGLGALVPVLRAQLQMNAEMREALADASSPEPVEAGL